jgi:hypothetical protein
LIHSAPARERFTSIHTHRERFGVRLLCRALITEPGNYRGWARTRQQPEQYHSKAYRNTLHRLDIRQSTSRTGSCVDGAAAVPDPNRDPTCLTGAHVNVSIRQGEVR